uniref:Uncharacterized protein n=1 Tax=Anopheles minimus TaxID=112268 RepID=A0A182WNU2_9DIPT
MWSNIDHRPQSGLSIFRDRVWLDRPELAIVNPAMAVDGDALDTAAIDRYEDDDDESVRTERQATKGAQHPARHNSYDFVISAKIQPTVYGWMLDSTFGENNRRAAERFLQLRIFNIPAYRVTRPKDLQRSN